MAGGYISPFGGLMQGMQAGQDEAARLQKAALEMRQQKFSNNMDMLGESRLQDAAKISAGNTTHTQFKSLSSAIDTATRGDFPRIRAQAEDFLTQNPESKIKRHHIEGMLQARQAEPSYIAAEQKFQFNATYAMKQSEMSKDAIKTMYSPEIRTDPDAFYAANIAFMEKWRSVVGQENYDAFMKAPLANQSKYLEDRAKAGKVGDEYEKAIQTKLNGLKSLLGWRLAKPANKGDLFEINLGLGGGVEGGRPDEMKFMMEAEDILRANPQLTDWQLLEYLDYKYPDVFHPDPADLLRTSAEDLSPYIQEKIQQEQQQKQQAAAEQEQAFQGLNPYGNLAPPAQAPPAQAPLTWQGSPVVQNPSDGKYYQKIGDDVYVLSDDEVTQMLTPTSDPASYSGLGGGWDPNAGPNPDQAQQANLELNLQATEEPEEGGTILDDIQDGINRSRYPMGAGQGDSIDPFKELLGPPVGTGGSGGM